MKQCILVVSFGTSYHETRKKTIGQIEHTIAEQFPDYEVRRAFTSGMIRYAQERFLDVELVTNTQTGLKVPLSAIVTKEFYVIPKDYVTYSEEDGTAGFNKVVEQGEGEDPTAEFVEAVIYDEDEENYYVDTSTFQEGDVIIKPDSQDTFTVEDTSPLEGV